MTRRTFSVAVLVLFGLCGSLAVHTSAAQTELQVQGIPAGYVAAWGDNFFGELGTQACCTARLRPAPVTGLTDVVSIAADWRHAVAARSDGSVAEWGKCCGPSAGIHPARVPGLASIIEVAAGEDFNLALRSNGTVWAWGSDFYGQLGPNGKQAQHTSCASTAQCSLPVELSGLDHVVQVAATYSIGLALRDDGTVWSWGSAGSPPDSETGWRMAAVHQIGGLARITAIAASYWLATALTADGHVWVWQFEWPASGAPEGWVQPIAIPGLDHAKGIGTNGRHVAAIRADGSVSTWDTVALNLAGLRLGPEMPVPGIHAVRAIAGNGHFLALEADGSVWAWGSNGSGQLGNGTTQDSATPVRVPGLIDAVAVMAGTYASYAIVRTPVAGTPPPTPAECLPHLGAGSGAAQPIGMAINQIAGQVYVLNAPRPVPQDQPVPCGASVTTLDLRSRKVRRSVLIGPMLRAPAHPFAVAEHEGHLFVASPGSRGNDNQASVSMLDVRSGKLLKTIPISGGAGALILGKATGRVFVVGSSSPSSTGTVITVLATDDGRIVRTETLDSLGEGTAPTVVDDRRRTVYVSSNNRIYVLDEGNGQKIGEINSMPCVGELAIDRRANRLFTSSTGAKEVSGFFCAIDPAAKRIVQTVDEGIFASASVLAVDEPAGVVLTLEGGSAFAAPSTYRLRRVTTGAVLPQPKALRVKSGIAPVLVDGHTGRIFLSDRPDGLSVLDPHGWRIIGTISLRPTGPMAVAESRRLIVSVGANDVISSASIDRIRR